MMSTHRCLNSSRNTLGRMIPIVSTSSEMVSLVRRRVGRFRALMPGAPLFDEGAEEHLDKCETSNRELLASLRHDENEKALHTIAFEDWQKYRMTKPVRALDADISQARHCSCTTRLCAIAMTLVYARYCWCRVSALRKARSQTAQTRFVQLTTSLGHVQAEIERESVKK